MSGFTWILSQHDTYQGYEAPFQAFDNEGDAVRTKDMMSKLFSVGSIHIHKVPIWPETALTCRVDEPQVGGGTGT